MMEWQERFWWTKRRKRPRGMTHGPLKINDGGRDSNEAEVIFEGTGGNDGGIPLVQSPISSPSADEEMERSKPLAEELLDTVMDLLSFSGFTIPSTFTQGTDPKVTLAIW
jgi:High-temperature-induced dauer-formation protein